MDINHAGLARKRPLNLSRHPSRAVLALAALSGLTAGGVALAQDAAPPGPRTGLPGTTGPGQPRTGETGLGLPADLTATPDPTRAPRAPGPVSATTGSTPRPGLRERRTRRSRQPTAGQTQSGFRSTIQPPGSIVADVQPVQTGVPDPNPAATPLAATPLATTPLRKRPLDDDPYGPVGVRVGNVTLFPVVGESLGYDTNPNRTQVGVRSSFVSQTEGELRVQSDWSRHELSGFLRGAYNDYPSNTAANRPEGAGRVDLRVDVRRDTQLDLEGRFQVDTQRPGSADLNAQVKTRPVVFTEGASLGVTERFNRVLVSLRGSVDRSDFDDAQLANGTTLDQGDRNLTAYGLRGRIGYELKPGLVPFVQADIDTRDYDRRLDSLGFARSSDGVGGRLGTTFEITRLLTGEVSAGVINRRYDDPRLRDLTSPVGDLTLAYAFSPVTTVRATAQAGVDETTVPGSNGVRTYRGSVEVAHDLRRNLTVTGGLSFSDYEYQGTTITERGFGALLRADYRLTRQIALRASYNYEQLHSTIVGSSYATNVFLLGIRLQP